MQWTDQLETGIPKIDEQHKELFRQTEILLDRSKVGRIKETVQFLGDYVLRHFIDEQGLQAAVKYPKAEAHKKFHTAFADKISELKKRIEESSDDIKFELATEINRTVIRWLKDHIMVHDKEFAVFYREHSKARQAKMASVVRRPVPAALASAGALPRNWRSDLTTGIPKLDEQHQEIFREAEALLGQPGQIQETLNYLAQYVDRHFAAEERAQASAAYPGAPAHLKGHADFVRRFQELKRRFDTAASARQGAAVKEISRFVVDWFKEHIISQDKPFAEFYRKSRSGGSGTGPKHGFLYRLFHFWR